MLDFVNQHQIVPIIDSIFDLRDGGKAFERMEKGDVRYRFVIDMQTL